MGRDEETLMAYEPAVVAFILGISALLFYLSFQLDMRYRPLKMVFFSTAMGVLVIGSRIVRVAVSQSTSDANILGLLDTMQVVMAILFYMTLAWMTIVFIMGLFEFIKNKGTKTMDNYEKFDEKARRY